MNKEKEKNKYGYCTWCGSPKKWGGEYNDGFSNETGEEVIREWSPKCSSGVLCFFKGISRNQPSGYDA